MEEKMSSDIKISTIAKFLNKEFYGNDININNVCSINNVKNNAVYFINKKKYEFDQSNRCLIICPESFKIETNSSSTFIYSKNPRLDFVRIVEKFFYKNKKKQVAETVKIGKNCNLAKDITVGEYSVIKDNVRIGSGSIINNHVVIESNTTVGNNCYIRSGSVIGEDCLSFEKDENGIPLKFPQLGNVIIGNNVEIGTKTVVCRAAIDSTIISNNVKINDNTHIGHNVFIDENTLIAGFVIISGGAIIGKNCWIGSNCTIRDGIKVGDNCFVGMASVLTKSIDKNSKTATISDLSQRDVIKYKKSIKG